MFSVEKRVLTTFPYWAVVLVLVLVTIMSLLPYKVSKALLHSSMSSIVIRWLMSKRGLA
jgi:hypothetical protein